MTHDMWPVTCDTWHVTCDMWETWYYLAQLVETGGICFVVGKKWENNVAHFYIAHISVHMLIRRESDHSRRSSRFFKFKQHYRKEHDNKRCENTKNAEKKDVIWDTYNYEEMSEKDN